MIIPFTHHTNTKGNIIFKFEHLPNNKKDILDRLETSWISTYEYNPLTNLIIKSQCSCPDFNINKMQDSPCKHITESKYLLNTILNTQLND